MEVISEESLNDLTSALDELVSDFEKDLGIEPSHHHSQESTDGTSRQPSIENASSGNDAKPLYTKPLPVPVKRSPSLPAQAKVALSPVLSPNNLLRSSTGQIASTKALPIPLKGLQSQPHSGSAPTPGRGNPLSPRQSQAQSPGVPVPAKRVTSPKTQPSNSPSPTPSPRGPPSRGTTPRTSQESIDLEHHLKKCSRCDESTAIIQCFECGGIFCNACSDFLHTGKWNRHQTSDLRSPSLSPSSSYIATSPVVVSTNGNQPAPQQVSQSKGIAFGRARSVMMENTDLKAALENIASEESQQHHTQPQQTPHHAPPTSHHAHQTQHHAPQTSHHSQQTRVVPAKTLTGLPLKMNSISELKSKLGTNINLGAFSPVSSPAPARVTKQKSSENLVPPAGNSGGKIVPAAPISVRPLSLNISVPDQDILVEKLVPPYCKVRFLLQMFLKQLLDDVPTEKKEKDKEYYQIYHNGVCLDPERTIASYTLIGEGSILELRLKKHDVILLKTGIADSAGSYVTLRVDETNSVWWFVHHVLRKMHSRGSEWSLPVPPDQFGLYSNDSLEPFDESALILDYRDRLDKVIFKPKPPTDEVLDFQVQISYTEEINVVMSFSLNTLVSTAMKAFVKTHVLKKEPLANISDYGFEIPPSEEDEGNLWLDENQKLDFYADRLRSTQNFILFKKRIRDYSVQQPNGTEFPWSFDYTTTIQDCLDVIAFNSPEVVQFYPLNEFSLSIVKDGTVLVEDRTLWSYDISGETLQMKRKLYPLLVFMGEYGQRKLLVDYSAVTYLIMDKIWKAFGIPAKKESEYSLRRLSPDVAIDMNKSLSAQNVEKSSTLMVKFLTVQRADSSQDVNIWDETEAGNILYEGESHHMRAGTFNKIIEHLTSERTADSDFTKAFILTYHSFANAQKVLSKLIERYYVPQPEFSTTQEEENFQRTAVVIQLKVCSVLKSWMEMQWQDFDHELTQQVVNFVDNLPPQFEIMSNQLRQSILKRTCGLKTTNRIKPMSAQRYLPEPIMKTRKRDDNLPPSLWDFDELEIARQLSIIEFENYEKIQPSELLNQNWTKPSTQHNTPNILKLIARSNDVSLWVASLILEPARSKLRALRFEKLIKIAQNLRALNNYSTLMAFLGGFNNAAVTRLKFTKALIPKRILDGLAEMEKLMSVDSSYKSYREAIRSSTPPCIPYLGTHLSDLVFIDEGNPSYLTGLINISKWVLTYKQIFEITKYQAIPFNFRSVPTIMQFVKDIPSREEKVYGLQLYDVSLSREPRGAEKVL
eukprot:TRINITY_DN4525_c0_g1_i1.p1 TRINITY_DN4525_c0_g1~~TRINITY_DN4525_c0_g1_i1.p1  ORF type:complete len:1270 (-),score=350.50 TRINITY_DN4525_c0_g1_i1:96-3905(-)